LNFFPAKNGISQYYSPCMILHLETAGKRKKAVFKWKLFITAYFVCKTKIPWNENLFKVDPNSKHLKTRQAKVFHMFVMKGMFLCKCGCQDSIQPAVAFMATRVT
jgi:hypothetical protein